MNEDKIFVVAAVLSSQSWPMEKFILTMHAVSAHSKEEATGLCIEKSLKDNSQYALVSTTTMGPFHGYSGETGTIRHKAE